MGGLEIVLEQILCVNQKFSFESKTTLFKCVPLVIFLLSMLSMHSKAFDFVFNLVCFPI